MAAKKPEKSKKKQVTKAKKSVKEKPLEMKAKDKSLAKKADKVAVIRANAIEKTKSKVRTALEKVAARVVKSVQAGSNGSGKTAKAVPAAKAAAAPAAKIAAKSTKVPPAKTLSAKAVSAKTEKLPAKGLRAEKEIPEKAAKAAKAAKGAKAAKAAAVPVVIEVPLKKGAKGAKGTKGTESGKLDAAAKKHAAAKNKCREVGCENEGHLSSYCRLHYIKNWRRIKKKESILSTGQLDGYVEELVAKYPDKYLDAIENDLHSEKEWTKVVSDLELVAGGEEDFVAEEDENPVTEATGRSRGAGFDDEDEDVY